jgi:Ca-activated chloride channel homolog
MRTRVLIFLGFIPFVLGFGEEAARKNSEANKLYDKADYSSAKLLYEEAEKLEPESDLLQYNIGNVYHKLNDHIDASKRYHKILQSEDEDLARGLKSQTHYNLGNSLVRMKKANEAIRQYKDALRLNPQDEDAKYNLEFLMKSQDQEKQNQKQDQKKEREKQNQDQNDSDRNQSGGSDQKKKETPGNKEGDSESQDEPSSDPGKDPQDPKEAASEGESERKSEGESEGESESEAKGEPASEGQDDGDAPRSGQGREEESRDNEGKASGKPDPQSSQKEQYGSILDALGEDEIRIMKSKNEKMKSQRVIRDKDW